jgi:hypothetical protein
LLLNNLGEFLVSWCLGGEKRLFGVASILNQERFL